MGACRVCAAAASVLAILGVAAVVAACGGDDSDSASAATSAGATSTTSAAPTTAATGDVDRRLPHRSRSGRRSGPSSATAIVKRIKDNKWGKSADGKTLTGPEGFTIDLTKCPAGWSDTEGLTDTTIKIGHADRRCRAPYADYGNLAQGR